MKFNIGQLVLVEDRYSNLVAARITDVGATDGVPDYLCHPADSKDDLCGCGGDDCKHGSWYLEPHVKSAGGAE